MQRESESEENVSWNEIGEVLDTEMSTVEDIRADLARNDKGNTCQTINNCMLVFQRDPVLKGAIRKNELSGKIDIVGNLGWQRTSSSLTDTDVYQIHWYLEKNYGLKNDRNINKATQVIHRDPNPGNIIVAEDKWGFIDFELSERNIRIFDPCYAATAILSESFEPGNESKLLKWIQIYKNIIYGYDDVAKLTAAEKKAVPYVVLSNQLIALAWFEGKEKYQEIFEINKKMTEWLVSVWSELSIE